MGQNCQWTYDICGKEAGRLFSPKWQNWGEVGSVMEVAETTAEAALAVVGRKDLMREELVIAGKHRDSAAVVQLSTSCLEVEERLVVGLSERMAGSQEPARIYSVVERS